MYNVKKLVRVVVNTIKEFRKLFSSGAKLPEREANHSPPHSTGIKYASRLHGVVLITPETTLPLPFTGIDTVASLGIQFGECFEKLKSTSGVLNLFMAWGHIPPFLSTRGPQGNLLKLHGSLLKMLPTYRFTHYSIILFNQMSH
jgi:hypothetical protein